jgi:exo-beta-1,3-glucanase (GH17 family)/cellulose synthase/poly-beta-1,6-N-acetylglucosamine synthase-like glycosyltransferase
MRRVAAVVALLACVHAGLWVLTQDRQTAPDIDGLLASLSYTPFEGVKHPDEGGYQPSLAQLRADLRTVAPYTRAVRTYSSTGGTDLVPQAAAELGLRVTVGAWLDRDPVRNEREIAKVIELARRHHNINGIVVGNETIYRDEIVVFPNDVRNLKPDDIKQLRALTPEARNKMTSDELKKFFNLSAEELARIETAQREKARNPAEPDPVQRVWEDINVAHLVKVIERVKRETGGTVPVTTGEIWSVWKSHPELVSAVDFIGAHILPYWEKTTFNAAVDKAILRYDELRAAFPGKKVVIAEFGWPSAGYNRGAAEPGRLEQAQVMRDFVARADALGIDYNIIEAFDQPWKTFEGSVGAYWGMFDTSRQPKFAWTGPITDSDHWKVATIAVLVGCLLSLPILGIAGATLAQAGLLALSAHAVGAWTATVFAYWYGHYFVLGAAFALGLGLTLLVPLVLIALARIDEIGAVVFGRGPRRLLPASISARADYAPKVSIHIPAYREPPEMLKQTLDAVARLAYPNFECVVVINNTPDPALWRPVEEHCRELGERFKFVNAERLEGYKAGALRLALAHTAADAEIIGVIDADYAVDADWLKELVPEFSDPKVGLIQAPQDHRDGERSPMHAAMNGEYAGFFDIGMVQRNEANAIIVHGTMCLVRRSALDAAGGWSSDTICEDTDLGLTILEQGWVAHYTNRRYGHGLLPDTFESYKKQRDRWASGGFQILRKHWRRFLPGASRLTPEQRREFAFGWLNWLGAETVGVAVAILNILWVPVVAFVGIAIPDKVLTLPIIAAFAVTLAHFTLLYRERVPLSGTRMVASMFAAMSLQWTIARAVGIALVNDHLKFVRTDKGGRTRKGPTFPAFHEAILGGLLVLGAGVVYWTNYEQVREVNLFAAVLVVQSLPFLSAVALAILDGSRANDFAFWHGIEAKLGELIPRRAAMANAAIANIADKIAEAPAPAPAENRVEAAQ